MRFFVGTFTRFGGEGILDCEIKNEKIVCKQVARGIQDPSYVILTRDKKTMYAVGADVGDMYTACIHEYCIQGNVIQHMNSKPSHGNGLCHLSLSPDGKYLYGAHYASGSVCVFSTQPTLNREDVIEHGEDAHAHQITAYQSYEIVVDLGLEAVIIYRRNESNGSLQKHSMLRLEGGPRHLAYGNGNIAYVAHELSNEVSAIRIGDSGELTLLQTLPTLPQKYQEESAAGAIRVSRDGKHVYVSNRGHGSIAIFDVQEDGTLRCGSFIPAGIFPRDFVCLPNGDFLIADQKSGIIWEDKSGKRLDFYPQMGAVCICMAE